MAKLSLTTITSRYASVDALNANFEAIEEALENTLSRDGTAPNVLEADIDVNGNRILNLPTPSTSGEPINLAWAVANYPDFQTVAGLADEIEALGDIVTEIVGVYGGLSNIATVASGISNVNAVGSNITSVNTVATNISNVNNVNTNIADVSTVAANIGSVNTTAGAISNVNTVAGAIASVNTVSGISSDVTAVALINGDVTTVSGISANVTTVAADGTDIGTVATNIANVNTVAGISGNVTTVAGDSANIGTVAGNIANLNTVAGISADVTTTAGNSTNITTVAGINSAVSTVAANNTNVSTVATNISDVIDVATNIADVQAAVASAAAAATSASNAATSETNAANSALAASTSETNAGLSATAASTSATAAGNAQTAAEAAQAAAEAAQEAIDGLYLGAQASDPSVDLNGDPVTAGDWYYNTSTAVTRIYDGSAWQNGAVDTASFLLSGNNLSDVNSATTAATNLGLGTTDTPEFASVKVNTLPSLGIADVAKVPLVATDGTLYQGYSSVAMGYRNLNINSFVVGTNGDTTNLSTGSYRNVVVGVNAATNLNINADRNVYVGGFAGTSVGAAGSISGNISGHVYIGYYAGGYQQSGKGSTGIGYTALLLENRTTASNPPFNTVFDSNNTAVGYEAGRNVADGYSNTFIGYKSGYYVTGDYNTVLGNYNGTSDANHDISTTDNNVIISDGAGNVRAHFLPDGELLLPSQPRFAARRTSNWATSSADYIFDTADINIGSCYDTTNGRFTAPVAGTYVIMFKVSRIDYAQAYFYIRKNGTIITGFTNRSTNGAQTMCHYTGMFELVAGDYITLYANNAFGWSYGDNGSYLVCRFEGYLLG